MRVPRAIAVRLTDGPAKFAASSALISHAMSENALAGTAACILVLCGGCLLRFLCVWSDDRQPLPDENRYYFKLRHASDLSFATEWYKEGKDLERGQSWAPKENLF